jgi:ubiquinone/menaquinone biosynthesis C-methylase UbiE
LKESFNSIQHLSEPNTSFEKMYFDLRLKEGNIFSLQEIQKLPANKTNPILWKQRAQTAALFASYIKKNNFSTVLEIGCGNGWFSNYISENSYCQSVVGLDINLTELTQASEAFPNNPKLTWWYADPFSADIPLQSFDIIIFNGSIQYFSDFRQVIERMQTLLKTKGEIHILDSPFYKSKRHQDLARTATEKYYIAVGFPEMKKFYFHHLLDDLNTFTYSILYQPSLISSIFRKMNLKFFNQNPFPWIRIMKQ